MDKMTTGRTRARTAPSGSATNLLGEIKMAELRLRKRSNRLGNAVSDAWLERVTAKSTAGMAAAAVRQSFKEIELDSVAGELKLGMYLARKLAVAGEAGILDPSMDVELGMLRAIMRKLG